MASLEDLIGPIKNRAHHWKREGTPVTCLSLDDVSDGNQNLCKSVLDLSTGEFEMTFYAM